MDKADIAALLALGAAFFIVLGETLRPGDAGWLTLFVAIAVMVVATAALARGQAVGATKQPV
jgi:hypothetical protein